ncbi:MAG TPA: DNA repair protein RecO [Verrucomicrobiae bacterium]|nr:DNA repair protein RecO [Verrucomicrobiae bacterium]
MTLPRAYKTRGVVLRARDLGEADRIVTLFTTEYGKLDAVAKGVRRAKSHLAGRMEFANEIAMTMHRGRNLDVIVTAELVSAHWERIVEPAAFACANVVSEIVASLCEPGLALPSVYELLTGAIAAIAKSAHPTDLLPRFEMRLLEALGVSPPTDACIRCGARLSDYAWVDVASGGFAGAECRERWRDALELDGEDLANAAALGAARGPGAARAARPRVAAAVELIVAHHLGRHPKSEGYAAEFAKAGATP